MVKRTDNHLVFYLNLYQDNAAANPAGNDIKAYIYYNSASVANNDYMLYFQNSTINTFPILIASVTELLDAALLSAIVDGSNNYILTFTTTNSTPSKFEIKALNTAPIFTVSFDSNFFTLFNTALTTSLNIIDNTAKFNDVATNACTFDVATINLGTQTTA